MSGLTLLLCLAAAPAATDGDLADEELLERAAAAVDEGLRTRDEPAVARKAFRRAAADYDELLRRGPHNAALYRNLGNACFLAGQLPRAIFAYRRGRALAPNDPDLREALELARSRIDFPPNSNVGRPPADDWPPWLPRLSPIQLVLIGAALLALFWLALMRYRMTRHGILPLAGGLALLGALAAGAGLLIQYQRHEEDLAHPVVVVARDGVSLRKGNGDQYPARDGVPPLKGGMEARLLDRRDDREGTHWLQVRLATGEIGWVNSAEAFVDE
jgi:tetratricopeptide (TPR) repeat protein